MSALISAFNRLFDIGGSRPEPVHFHSGEHGPIVCHDATCSSPRLSLRDTVTFR